MHPWPSSLVKMQPHYFCLIIRGLSAQAPPSLSGERIFRNVLQSAGETFHILPRTLSHLVYEGRHRLTLVLSFQHLGVPGATLVRDWLLANAAVSPLTEKRGWRVIGYQNSLQGILFTLLLQICYLPIQVAECAGHWTGFTMDMIHNLLIFHCHWIWSLSCIPRKQKKSNFTSNCAYLRLAVLEGRHLQSSRLNMRKLKGSLIASPRSNRLLEIIPYEVAGRLNACAFIYCAVFLQQSSAGSRRINGSTRQADTVPKCTF